MNLFIGNLPINATEGDLYQLLNLSRGEGARRLRIFKKPARDGRTSRFGLLYVETTADLRKFLKRARDAILNGQTLSVREYVPRAIGNERRAVNWRERNWTHSERRRTERRSNV